MSVKNLKTTLDMIKIEHTLFALPFAMLGAFLAAGGIPPFHKLLWITVCMVGARSAAMAFNRLVDAEYDAANPRTRMRALPAGLLSRKFVIAFTIVSSLIFLIGAAMLNSTTLLLSPVALGSVLFYSYTKRFTSLSHLVLGWCLAIAPMGAWIAVKGEFDLLPLVLSGVVMLWTAGFDIIYACQDYEFDVSVGLNSIPQRFGIARALWVARLLHLCVFGLLLLLYWLAQLSWPGAIGLILAGALLIRQHSLVSPQDLSRLDAAFFTANAMLSVILFISIGLDLLLRA